jgi:hypothetical protein
VLPDLQLRHLPRTRRRHFLALMVGAPRPPAPAPPGGPPSTFLSVDGGRSWTSSSSTSRGGGSVGTLKTGYPHIQAPSQDKRHNSSRGATCPRDFGARLLAQGSSGGAACPRGSGSHLPARGSSRAATCPRGSGSRLPAQGTSEAATYHLGSSSRLLA